MCYDRRGVARRSPSSVARRSRSGRDGPARPGACYAAHAMCAPPAVPSLRTPLRPVANLFAVLMVSVATLQVVSRVSGSEFPERECCDPMSATASVSPYYDATTADGYGTGGGGTALQPKTKQTISVLNCLTARELCFKDVACAAILEVIPRVCGPELVACSTVTVTKCQAALRTLENFPLFKPTCLCHEPSVDPECNSFRDFLYDHPCLYVLKKEHDPFPVEALPTCNHALAVCQANAKCVALFEQFKANCKVRSGKCHMESRERCFESWARMRQTPIFGCICPSNHMKRRCDQIFNTLNYNRCVGYDAVEPEAVGELAFRSTCQLALDSCHQKFNCSRALSPVLRDCREYSKCTQGSCLEALRKFYRSIDISDSIDIAFCQCKKSDKHGGCKEAEYKLHPICAQRKNDGQLPACHTLPEKCKEDRTCRTHLERYEQACAVDSLTKTCAGPVADCRIAMLGIMGTPLKFNCACRGTDTAQLYDCLGWQRLLWINPCVEEAKKDYHIQLAAAEHAQQFGSSALSTAVIASTPAASNHRSHNHRQTPTHTPPPAPAQYAEPPATTVVLTTQAVIAADLSTQQTTPSIPTSTMSTPAPSTSTSSSTSTSTITTPQPTSSSSTSTVAPTIPSTFPTSSTTSTSTQKPSTSSPRPTTSTEPPRYCVLQRPQQTRHLIREGSGMRFQRANEPECSEVCQCQPGDALVCNTVCVERTPCRTDYAFYNHNSPAYQAYRGRCVCYSGRFICMRPAPDSYSLPEGVFLFVGYSEREETLLQQLSNLTVYDVASTLQDHMRAQDRDHGGAGDEVLCTLLLHNVTRENLILVAKLVHTNLSEDLGSLELLRREKEECVGPLHDIVEKINAKHPDFHSHLLLSILKLGLVEVKVPDRTSSGASTHSLSALLLLLLLPLLPLSLDHRQFGLLLKPLD